LSERLQELARNKLPEIEALIDRAEQVRGWLTLATGCECQTVDECLLFETPVSGDRAAAFAVRGT
jgi:hypothetical protein